MNSTAIIDLRLSMTAYLREAKAEGKMDQIGEGRGLVFTAGNAVRGHACHLSFPAIEAASIHLLVTAH